VRVLVAGHGARLRGRHLEIVGDSQAAGASLSFAATKICSDSLGDTLTEISNTQYSDAVFVDVKTLLED
jgi:hypothetical protein